jgi:hypothetical protein
MRVNTPDGITWPSVSTYVRSGGYPGLASQPTMGALLPFHDQPDTPYRPESGITHLRSWRRVGRDGETASAT